MKNRKLLGCSFPVVIGIGILFLALAFYTFLGGPIGSAIFPINYPEWLKVPQPSPELPPEALFNIGSFPVTNTMVTAWISILLIVSLSYFAFRKPKIVPKGLQAVMEFIFGSLLNYCQSVAGEKNGRRFFPVVATIFIFVITNAWLSLFPVFGGAIVLNESGKAVPLLRGANTDLNVALALGLFSFVAVEYFGIKESGFLHYAGKFVRTRQLRSGMGKLFKGNFKSAISGIMFGFLDLATGAIELLSEFIRIISFTFRLFGNMIAGEILLLIMTLLIAFGVPVIFYGLELFVGFVQALIFGGLTLVFMTMAVSTHEEENA